ncbi:pentapeptide repeat-containing protein [Candidatus Pantoea floridensis]|nr:pentapeptide repeat-containing protein [Pantoea floridensis]
MMSKIHPAAALTAAIPMPRKVFRDTAFTESAALQNLQDCEFINCHFGSITLQQANWSGLKFERCRFQSVNFAGCELNDCHFAQCELVDCHWHAGRCQRCTSQQSVWRQCEFHYHHSKAMTFQGGQWQSIILNTCLSEHWNLIQIPITQLQLLHGSAHDWNICQCEFQNGCWQDIEIQRQVASECRFKHVVLGHRHGPGQTWYQCQWLQCQLNELTLEGGSFHRNQFDACNFAASHFRHTVLVESQFSQCCLAGFYAEAIQGEKLQLSACSLDASRWSHCWLQQSEFHHCVGESSDFSYSDLRAAHLSGLPDNTLLTDARRFGATPAASVENEPALKAIADWHQTCRPGPDHLHTSLAIKGTSKYV